jgi:hypothetical protein
MALTGTDASLVCQRGHLYQVDVLDVRMREVAHRSDHTDVRHPAVIPGVHGNFNVLADYKPDDGERVRVGSTGALWTRFNDRMYEHRNFVPEGMRDLKLSSVASSSDFYTKLHQDVPFVRRAAETMIWAWTRMNANQGVALSFDYIAAFKNAPPEVNLAHTYRLAGIDTTGPNYKLIFRAPKSEVSISLEVEAHTIFKTKTTWSEGLCQWQIYMGE